MKKDRFALSICLVAAIAVVLTTAVPAQAEENSAEEALKALQRRVSKLESVEKELKDVKARLEKLESMGLPPADEEAIGKRVEEWFDQNRETIIEQMTGPEAKRALLGFDMEMAGYLTFIYQTVLTSNVIDKNGDGERDNARRDALSFSFGLEMTARLAENQYAFMLIEGGNGDSIDAFIPNNMGLNDDANPTADPLDPTNSGSASDMRVTEAYYEGSFFTDKFVITFGKLDLTNYFDSNAVANDEMWQFISSSLVNNAAIAFPDDNDAAIRMLYSPFGGVDLDDEDENATDFLLLQLGLSETDTNFNEVTQDGLVIGEVWFRPHKHPSLKRFVNGRPGNYRLGGWLSEADTLSLREMRRGDEEGESTLSGVYLSFDQEVYDNITLFMRYGVQDNSLALNEAFWSFGFQLDGSMWGRENDRLGFGTAINVKNARAHFARPEFQKNEHLYELYYMFHVTDFLHISPVFQVLDNPGGESRSSTAAVAGLRLQFDF
ncbi:MAG: hypothetical protein DRP79_03980 [Planctomycetota bacterium]|nr:MAG: hypothetical protein DRP79_03980 [Planctomycetota bacterium]